MPRPTSPELQHPGLHHKRIGDVIVTAMNDGMFEGAFAMLVQPPGRRGRGSASGGVSARSRRGLAINCFLIHTADRLVLVDSGFGGAIGPLAGHLDRRPPSTLGVAPSRYRHGAVHPLASRSRRRSRQ